MKRSLKGLQNSPKVSKEDVERIAAKMDPHTVQDIGDTINQYSGMSEAELFNILKGQMRSGSITPGNMDEVAGKLGQMLSPEQRKRMQDVLRMLRN